MKRVLQKEEIISEIYAGKEVSAIAWDMEEYIYLKDGMIVDSEDKAFNLAEEEEEDWVLYIAPNPTVKKLNKLEAIQAVYDGKRVKGASWGNKELELANGQIMLNSKSFNIMADDEQDWIIIIEEKEEISTRQSNEIKELKSMIKELLSKEDKEQVGEGKKDNVSDTAKTLNDVYGVSTPKEIQAQFKELLESATSTLEIEKIVCDYIPYCWIGNKTLGTSTVYYSHMTKVIKSIENEEHRDTALALFAAPKKAYESVQEKVADKKKAQIRKPKTFDKKDIEDIILGVKHKILSNDYSDKAKQTDIKREKAYWAFTYLTMVTGRRQTELLKTLVIKNKSSIWQYCGVLKDREKGKCVEAFALDNDFEFLSDLTISLQDHIESEINEKIHAKTSPIKNAKERKKLQKELAEEYFEEREINSKFNNSFNAALKRITGKPFTSSNWRDIYAELLYLKDGIEDGSHIDRRDFKAKVLGHTYNKNLSATEHYDGWEVK